MKYLSSQPYTILNNTKTTYICCTRNHAQKKNEEVKIKILIYETKEKTNSGPQQFHPSH